MLNNKNNKSNKTIIIHSKVSYGYVGSNTTSFILQLYGYDAIAVPTVLYSNHLGYPTVGGGVVPSDLFSDTLDGIFKLNILGDVSTIMTGFIGSVEQVKITAKFIQKAKQINPKIVYLCDPVMGDSDKGLYVPDDIPEAIVENLISLADILTPNQFETEMIINKPIYSFDNIISMLNTRFDLSKQKIVITGCQLEDMSKNLISNCIIEDFKANVVSNQKVDLHPPGTGELFTAHLLLLMYCNTSLTDAAMSSGNILTRVLSGMLNAGSRQIELSDILFSKECVEGRM